MLFNLSFQRRSQPGFGMSLEIFASVRTQEDLCASFAVVTQSPAPRWADATVVASRAQTAARTNLDITQTPFRFTNATGTVYCIVCALENKVPVKRLRIALMMFGVQAFGADWLTDGGDTRRNNWQKDEK